ncbi:NUDIX domain-containing protein [Alicyclobacillus kakegawensis]|uniref:NUDIX domain-containing protein n=1 Tax=Alicyclobacillus kakegawensis TaxID=392012 RepID=UPI00082E8B76|nr:NUDIX domain-containing protein [Alicyclobacillus kakegawensis]
MPHTDPTWRQAAGLRLDSPSVRSPHSVLVFPVYQGSIVWVQHPQRGWEVPGGKCEPGESADAAARRETWEESGAVIEKLTWLAEYQIPQPTGGPWYKWVYWAEVRQWRARPDTSETMAVRLGKLPEPQRLRRDRAVSPVLKDCVYTQLFPLLRARLITYESDLTDPRGASHPGLSEKTGRADE